jgi:hypothetical protein
VVMLMKRGQRGRRRWRRGGDHLHVTHAVTVVRALARRSRGSATARAARGGVGQPNGVVRGGAEGRGVALGGVL